MGEENCARFDHHKAYGNEKISIVKLMVIENFQSPSL
jgi:hypothetical protein